MNELIPIEDLREDLVPNTLVAIVIRVDHNVVRAVGSPAKKNATRFWMDLADDGGRVSFKYGDISEAYWAPAGFRW